MLRVASLSCRAWPDRITTPRSPCGSRLGERDRSLVSALCAGLTEIRAHRTAGASSRQVFYRAEKGLVPCRVTSAAPLSSAQQSQVQKAMEQRAGKGATLIMDYATNPAMLGGLVVKMGEAVFDNSVATRLERLQTQLLVPLS